MLAKKTDKRKSNLYNKVSQWLLLQEAHSKRLNAILHTCNKEQFCINYFKLLEFVKPKLQRAEQRSEKENQITTIVYTTSSSNK